jgi:NAD(P)-dependent dehydrogenase (short-subunit alcohol dehydrogenase family)
MNLMLKGQHALVTGGARGIGAAIAKVLAEAGVNLTLLGRDQAQLERHAQELRELVRVQVAVADVTDAVAVKNAFESATQVLGAITVLVNNAGQAHSQPFLKTDLTLWQTMLEVNLTGTFLCMQSALPFMLETGWGRIVNVSSTAGLVGYPYVAAYSAAKHGVIGLTRSVALEVARKNITVNAVCPGYTETEIVTQTLANIVQKTGRSQTEARAELVKHNPQGRMISPLEVAQTVLWLCQPSSGAITGQAISISGGEVMS